jgi:hypothetical protein
MNKLRLDGFARGDEEDKRVSLDIAALFASPTGDSVLKYLRSITIEAVNGPNVTDAELRHMEGQRYLVGLLERRIKHGQKVKQDE